MPIFTNEVSAEIREQSTYNAAYGCWVTPDHRCWVWSSGPHGEGGEWQDEANKPAVVAVWLEDDYRDKQHEPVA